MVEKEIENISSFISKNKIENSMKVYRGTSYSSLARLAGLSEKIIMNNPFSLMGKVLKEEAFMSTSSLKEVGEGFSNGKVLLKIATSGNEKVAYINEAEEEYLFDRGQKLLIVGVSKNNKKVREMPELILKCKII